MPEQSHGGCCGLTFLPAGFLGLPNLARFCGDVRQGVACIDNALRPICQFLVVHRLVIRGDDYRIKAFQRLPIPTHGTSSRPMRLTRLIGMAKATPELLPLFEAMAVLMPTTRPS